MKERLRLAGRSPTRSGPKPIGRWASVLCSVQRQLVLETPEFGQGSSNSTGGYDPGRAGAFFSAAPVEPHRGRA